MSFQIDIFCCGDIIEENTSTLQNIKEKFYSNDEVGFLIILPGNFVWGVV